MSENPAHKRDLPPVYNNVIKPPGMARLHAKTTATTCFLLLQYTNAIHTTCPCVFWFSRKNFRDNELKFCIFFITSIHM